MGVGATGVFVAVGTAVGVDVGHRLRSARFFAVHGSGVGVLAGVDVAVGGAAVCVGAAVAVGRGVGLASGVGVRVRVGAGVTEGLGIAVSVGLGDGGRGDGVDVTAAARAPAAGPEATGVAARLSCAACGIRSEDSGAMSAARGSAE
ncbi:MAG: hypothetical protein HYX50_03355 [Chloroflexi bacterium]|nr:hypothetical protein [Chloroflexota bacterium]